MQTVIAIAGQKRSGKDTLARFIMLANKFYVRYAFADPVRDAAKAFFGWTDDDFSDSRKEVIDPYWGISPRQALQYIGTEVGREGFAKRFPEFAEVTGSQVWVKRMYRFLESLPPERNCVISDMRFQSEFDGVKELTNKGWRVVMLGVTRPGAIGDRHASEVEVPQLIEQCDYVIENNSTIEEMNKFAESILRPPGII